MTNLNWIETLEYCNKLSEYYELQPVYEIEDKELKAIIQMKQHSSLEIQMKKYILQELKKLMLQEYMIVQEMFGKFAIMRLSLYQIFIQKKMD